MKYRLFSQASSYSDSSFHVLLAVVLFPNWSFISFNRIHQCTEVTQDWLVTTHHEIGHVYYFMLFWQQPYIYRDSANPAFHEAVGDTISLSVSTPQYLAEIGLLEDFKPDEGKPATVSQSDAYETPSLLSPSVIGSSTFKQTYTSTILDKSPWDSTAIFIFFCHFSVSS